MDGKSLGRNPRRLGCALSADPQLIDAFDGLAARPAKQRPAVAAQQRVGNGLGAVRAVKLGGGRLGIGHAAIIALAESPRKRLNDVILSLECGRFPTSSWRR